MSAAHTPGPWAQSHRAGDDDTFSTEVYCQAGKTIASIAWYPVATPSGTVTSREANARLIAAAPTMLEALIDARAMLACAVSAAARECQETGEPEFDVCEHYGIQKIDAAIAAATGRTE